MRIGFLSGHDPGVRSNLSGMPYAMSRALAAQGAEILPFVPAGVKPHWLRRARSRIARFVPAPLRSALKKGLGLSGNGAPPGVDPETEYRMHREDAIRLSREVRDRVLEHDLDVVFGCCISKLLFELEVPVPIVYYSDITARLILETYPRYRARSEGFHRICEEQEQRGLKRASAVVFATEVARRSAVEDYGVDPGAASVVPMGANVEPESGAPDRIDPEPPSRTSLRLVMTSADPERKRLDLAIDVVDLLRSDGWEASLELIGRPTPKAEAHPHVRCLGHLSLDSAADRRRNLDALCRSHLMILPSLGEAFGIAPCEAAHVGKPSVVSEAGGLPEVVRDGATGLVLPLTATAADYARAIAGLAGDPDRYRAMSFAAFHRARTTYTWEHWAGGLLGVMDRVLRSSCVVR